MLKRIFDENDFSEKHNFIDMGCGKGYVMAVASEYLFEKIGREYTEKLCDICRRNLDILQLN